MTLNPLPLLSSAASAATGFLGGIQTYLIVGAVTLALGLAGGAYAGYRWEHGALASLQLADAQAVTQAVQKEAKSAAAQAQVSLTAAVAEAGAQAQIITHTVTVTKEIPVYVTPVQDSRGCITVGLMRILRAASSQTDPDTLQLAAGQSDDDCSDVDASTLAGWFTGYSAAAEANSEQLDALEKWITDNHAAQVVP